jgi:hypothetical protein
MEHTEEVRFDADDHARLRRAADLVGKDVETFVRDAALQVADDPFLKALEHAGETVARNSGIFAAAEPEPERAPAAGDGEWADAAPMSSRDLHVEHRRAA